MRTLLLGLLATATATTVLYSTNPLHHLVVNPIAGMNIGYRFYDHFCRVHYNNQTDRNACMMRGTSTLPPNSECDKSLRIWEYQSNSSSRPAPRPIVAPAVDQPHPLRPPRRREWRFAPSACAPMPQQVGRCRATRGMRRPSPRIASPERLSASLERMRGDDGKPLRLLWQRGRFRRFPVPFLVPHWCNLNVPGCHADVEGCRAPDDRRDRDGDGKISRPFLR